MPGLKHATKKRLAKSTTRRRTLYSGISSEHIEYRERLTNVSSSIKSLIREIRSARQVWLDLARHQNGFAEALVKSLPSDGAVRSHAKEVETTVQQLQRMILDDDSPSTPHRRILGVLDAYLKLIQIVEKNYPALETAYSEVLRYQRKVDKLSRKKKREEALHRNMAKLQDARAVYDTILKDVIGKQREAFDKHEAVFQCAHHAFWIAHDKYAQVVNEATKNIRQESVAVREHLVNIDVSNTPKLTAIPRVKMLPPPQPQVTPVPTLEIPSDTSSAKVVSPVPQNMSGSPTQIVQTVSTSSPQVHTNPPQDYSAQVVHFQTGTIEPTRHLVVPSAPSPETFMHTRHIQEIPEQVYATIPSNQVVHTHRPSARYYSQEQSVVHLTPQKPSVSVSLPPQAIAPQLPTEIPPPPHAVHQQPARVPV